MKCFNMSIHVGGFHWYSFMNYPKFTADFSEEIRDKLWSVISSYFGQDHASC